MITHPVEQIEDRHAKTVGNDLDGVDCGIRLTSLYPAQVGLIEAALLTELDLA